jgi:NADPH:quinone reductase-like Zn-dependent oxidoreductase
MKAVVFDRFGDPAEVLHVRDVPAPKPGPGQVRVRMLASPLNPSDLMMVRGRYGVVPPLPATPGFEGVGVVEEAGGGLLGRLRLGKRVAVLNAGGGNWQEAVVVPAQHVVPVAAELSDDQAAGFFVNPASALVMTRDVLRIPRGAWLAQTAAGSALGRMIIRLGKRDGFRTINIVRRREQADELLRAGGDAAICTADESIPERVRAITGGAGVKYALDAVGGATGSALLQALALEGRMLVYGTLSGEPLTLDPRPLLLGNHCVQGFWLSVWVRRQSKLRMLWLFRSVNRLAREGVLTTAVGATYSLDEIQTAVREAEKPGRAGKVVLRIGNR